MKRFKELEKAATDLQRVYRGHVARLERNFLLLRNKLNKEEAERYETTTRVGVWWLQQNVPFQNSPLKDFGRRRDHFTAKGWGHHEGNAGFVSLQCNDEFLMSDVTRKFTENLAKTGYDRRRAGEFKGGLLAVRGKGQSIVSKNSSGHPDVPPPPPPSK